jgi:hypothetical protein
MIFSGSAATERSYPDGAMYRSTAALRAPYSPRIDIVQPIRRRSAAVADQI